MRPTRTVEDSGFEGTDLEELRQLLFGWNTRDLQELRARLLNPSLRPADLSEVLAEAIALGYARGPRLRQAILPVVEDALKESVKADPTTITSVIYPVLGPAIRRSIRSALDGLVESISRMIEHSFSIQGLRWRLEAYRTGRPFGDIVLAHTLVYRVEQVLLIEVPTGLLLQHVWSEGVTPQDADLVAGMLTAIRDFVHTSFSLDRGEALDQMQAGALTLVIESGPRAVMVGVVRGTVMPEIRERLQETLEVVHREFPREFEQFNGRAEVFDVTADHLHACLESRIATPGRGSNRAALLVLGAIALLIAIPLALVGRLQWQWSQYLRALATRPGLAVLESSRGLTSFSISGFRDPLEVDPSTLLEPAGVTPQRVTAAWQLFHTSVPDFVVTRAQRALQPPAGVQIAFENGALRLTGRAPRAWIARARGIAPLLAGVAGVDESRLIDADVAALEEGARRLAARVIGFPLASAWPDSAGLTALDDAARDVTALIADADRLGFTVQVAATGNTDETGTPERNAELAKARAAAVIRLLTLRGVPAAALTSTSDTTAPGTTSATLRMTWSPRESVR